ncbi:hypothetical protein [Bradyrhizobium sp. CCBAU 51753]|uniref:hypothetical protein n=1 Tax=Bradyrhizobium sp. CCBAU 51753 TaxID=1325100 RepID=UPI00188CA052|nr:hypothetical protein [Bradyrhizobium sp. CCBAU 51753]
MIVQMIQHWPKLPPPRNLLWIERGVPLDESRPRGLNISPFLKLPELRAAIIKQSPELPWRELVHVESKLFWNDRERLGRVIAPSAAKLIMQILLHSSRDRR